MRLVFGIGLFGIIKLIGDLDANITKLWESVALIVAVELSSSFIYLIINNGIIDNKAAAIL